MSFLQLCDLLNADEYSVGASNEIVGILLHVVSTTGHDFYDVVN